jgi:hypothetical protein
VLLLYSQIKNFLKIFFLYKKKNLAFINSEFQLINLIELIDKKKINNDQIIIFIGFGRPEYLILKNYFNILKKLKKEINICKIKINSFLLFCIIIINIFRKYNSISVGRYLSESFFLNFFLHSQYKYILDDGVENLNFKKFNIFNTCKFNLINFFFLKRINKIIFFTIFYNYFRKFYYIGNSYAYLKTFYKKKKKEKKILFLGGGILSDNIISRNDYYKFLLKIKKKFKNYSLIYYPHPLEINDQNLKFFLKNKNIPFVIKKLPINLDLLDFKTYPEIVISPFSTALISLSLLLKEYKIKFYYCSPKFFEVSKFSKDIKISYQYFNSQNEILKLNV